MRHPLGIDLDLRLTLKSQTGATVDPTPLYPQFVLIPRSSGGVSPYDMQAYDAANGIASLHVPGASLTDRNGYGIEIYAREIDPLKPSGLMARGQMVTDGYAYSSPGPLSMINVPVIEGPPGPQGEPGIGIQGEPGEPGERGSKWTSGPGEPSSPPPLDTLTGDMYLDDRDRHRLDMDRRRLGGDRAMNDGTRPPA